MTSIFAKHHGIPLSQAKKLDASSLTVHKITEEQAQRLNEARKNQFKTLAKPEQADNHPSNIYATIRVNGKVAATLYNSGAVSMSSAVHGKVKNLPSMGEGETMIGPMLAKKRAEDIAKALGGSVEVADTAVNQSQWHNRAPVEWVYDHAGLEAAMNSATAKTRFDTQAIAQKEQPSKEPVEPTMAEAAKQEFMEFMSQSTEEKYLDMILKEMGLTKEDLAAMSPEEREDIIKKVQERMMKDTEEEAGIPLSSTAVNILSS
jgi:hypothetical protein